jgi:hypothetical protein
MIVPHHIRNESIVSITDEGSLLPILVSKKKLIDSIVTPSQQNRIISDDEISHELGVNNISNPFSTNNDSTDNLVNTLLESDKKIMSQMEELKFKRDNFWKSCCNLIIDKRATVFFTQVGIGMSVIVFCMIKLSVSQRYECTGDDPSIFLGLMSVVLGWFVPSPTMS